MSSKQDERWQFSSDECSVLTSLANASIEHTLRTHCLMPIAVDEFAPRLQQTCATFVTLRHTKGELKHTILNSVGVTHAIRPIVMDIVANAHQVCFDDEHNIVVDNDALQALHLRISVLNALEEMKISSELDLLKQIRPGIDGLILEEEFTRATFLPVVWERLPKTEEFLSHLKLKAGLPPDYWSQNLKFYRYTTEVI